MKDRIPTKPGRVQLVPSPDDDDLFILTRADEPTETGTPLNKASLLSDATAAAFGLTGDAATVNGALALVSSGYSRVLNGISVPGADTPAKRGDIYVMDSGGERHAYLCDAVGERAIDLGADWEQGNITTGGVSSDASYRVRSQVVNVPAGTVFSVASGFRFALYKFNAAGTYESAVSFRTANYTVSADSRYRILIQAYPEDTSVTADIATFAAALTATLSGSHWTALAGAREVRKTAIFTSSAFWNVPADLRGSVTVQCFGGGAGGSNYTSGVGRGGGGGHMATWTGTLSAKKYEITVGAGGAAGQDGGASSFGSLCTANGGSGASGGSGGGGGGSVAADKLGGSGSYGGGGGSYNGIGGAGGTYGGGGGGGTGGNGGSGKSATYSGGSGSGNYGGGGGGWTANGKNATSSTGGAGGAGMNTTGFGLDFEGTGAAGTVSGGGGGYGGAGGSGLKTGSASTGGGGGGYGASGGAAGSSSGGGGGGYGGRGGDGYDNAGGGGGGYGLSGQGGSAASGKSRNGGIAAGGAPLSGQYAQDGRGGDGCVVIYYTGIEVV